MQSRAGISNRNRASRPSCVVFAKRPENEKSAQRHNLPLDAVQLGNFDRCRESLKLYVRIIPHVGSDCNSDFSVVLSFLGFLLVDKGFVLKTASVKHIK